MRNFLIAALLTVASASAHAELSVLDTAEWGGSSYFLLDKSSWFDAQVQAELMGGNLITINSAEENYFIYDLWGAQGTSPESRDYLWLGLTDEDEEGNFVWVSGEDVTYTNFKPGEPNDTSHRENHVYMWYRGAGTEGTWNDFPGSLGVDYQTGIYGVVEIPNTASSVPVFGSAAISLALLSLFRLRRHA